MSDRARRVVSPAPGPLSWLFPEIAAFDPRVPEDVLDCAQCALPTARLLELLRKYGEVAIASGPRGRAMQRVLRQALRDGGPRVVLDETVEQFEPVFADAAADARPGAVMIASGTWCAMAELEPGQVGLFPLRPDHAMEDVEAGRRASSASRGRIVPVFLTDPRPAEVAHTRLAESWWGLLPGDHYPDCLRAAHHGWMRELWPGRFLKFRSLEANALAGFDLYDESLRGRYDALPTRDHPLVNRPLILGIDGIDGAGKSSQLTALLAHLESRGLRVGVHKIYRHGVFHETVTDITRQCVGGGNLHLWRLQRHAKLFDSVKYYYSSVVPDMSRCDVLIFDRYVQTHRAAGLGRYGHDPYAREFLSIYPLADRVYLLDLPEETALARIAERQERTVDENPYMLSRFRAALLEIADEERMVVLDSEASIEDNHARIREDVDRMLEARA
jgi:dTMP kinase